MRTFAALAEELDARYPNHTELWTAYHLKKHPYSRDALDWGVCQAHHFDRGPKLGPWLQLVERARGWLEAQTELRDRVRFVPFYEVGEDFFVQCKPPYDGGYNTAMYEEFLWHRSCEPAPSFFPQLAALHQRVAEALRFAPRGPEAELLSKIIHATLIKPYPHLFWLDEEGWAVYQPDIRAEDLQRWERLS